MSDDTLYPCRFCGNKEDFLYQQDLMGFDYLRCNKCGHQGQFYTKEDGLTVVSAKTLWNARNEKHNPFIKEE